MKVFASQFLENPSSDFVINPSLWKWQPSNKDVKTIYASGSKTATRSSTYASEKDNESDNDRPNEGS
jgi:hypothetical protein